MQIAWPRHAFVAIASLTLLARPAVAGEDDISPQAAAYLKVPLATVRVAVDKATVYSAPDENSEPLRAYIWVAPIRVDHRKLRDAPHGWIPIEIFGKIEGRKDQPKGGWIRRRDVVILADFKLVTGCWPIKSVVHVAGDYAVEVAFKVDGSATAKEWSDEPKMNVAPPEKAQIYMARNIALVEGKRKGGHYYFTAGLRPDERRLYPEGALAEEQESFSDSELKNCESGPLLRP
jgi:hypothetical protein